MMFILVLFFAVQFLESSALHLQWSHNLHASKCFRSHEKQVKHSLKSQ